MVPGLARTMERWIFLTLLITGNTFIANEKFTNCCNTEILNIKKIYMSFSLHEKRSFCPSNCETTHAKRIVLELSQKLLRTDHILTSNYPHTKKDEFEI